MSTRHRRRPFHRRSADRFSRRWLLGAIGAGATLLPFLRHAGRANPTEGPPARFVAFSTPNLALGPVTDDVTNPIRAGARWRPPEGALDQPFPHPMDEIEAFRPDILMLDGLDMKFRRGDHGSINVVLTGRQPRYPDGATTMYDAIGTGISLDQYIADELGDRSLVLGVNCKAGSGTTRLVHLGDANPVTPIENPVEAFESVFGEFGPGNTPNEAQARRIHAQLSVLDASASELNRLLTDPRLGTADRIKLEQHLDHTRTLEQRLQDQLMGTAECDSAVVPTPSDGAPISRMLLQMDVMVQALACNITRVGVLQTGHSGDTFGEHIECPELGIDMPVGVSEHLDLAHFGGASNNLVPLTDAERRAYTQQLERIYYWLFGQLLQRLAAVPEADGTLLDNTCVLWCKSLSYDHNTNDMLFMLAGGKNLGIGGGRYKYFGGDRAHNGLLTTCANLVGIDILSFGDPGVDSSPLDI